MNYNYLPPWFEEIMNHTEGRAAEFGFLFQPPYGENDIVADLHGHTRTFSDGDRSIIFYKKTIEDECIKKAATTDHDSIGYDNELDDLINGVEVTSLLDEDEIEILVLNFNHETAQSLIDSGAFPFLNKDFKILRNIELTKRRIEICNKLRITSKPISLSDLLSVIVEDENGLQKSIPFSEIGINANHVLTEENPAPKTIVYGSKVYPINYNFLIRKLFDRIHSDKKGLQYLLSVAESDPSFNPHSADDFLKSLISNKSGALHVDTNGFWPTAQQVIDFAKNTGGVAILAHPFGYNKKINITTKELLKKILRLGIDGVEVFHGFNQSDEIEYLYKFCYENNLLVTIGSDTHGFVSNQGGKMTPGIAPGVGYQARFHENNIDETSTSVYNLHYFGTGAWRGEKEFDHLSLPSSIKDVFDIQKAIIAEKVKLSKPQSEK